MEPQFPSINHPESVSSKLLTEHLADLEAQIQHASFGKISPQDRNALLRQCSYMNLDLYLAEKLVAHLSRAIEYWERLLLDETLGTEEKFEYLVNLSVGLGYRYQEIGNIADLDRAIQVGEQGLLEHTTDLNKSTMLFNNIGALLHNRYRQTKDETDLKRAIQLCDRTISQISIDSPQLPFFLDNLGIFLRDLYNTTTDLSELDQAIQAWEQAVELTQNDDLLLADRLSDLWGAVCMRYETSKNLSDIDWFFQICQSAVQRFSDYLPSQLICLAQLGQCFKDRYEYTNNFSDLEKATTILEEVVAQAPEESLHLPDYFHHLGTSLIQCYEKTNNRQTLEQAIKYLEQSTHQMATDNPKAHVYWNALGLALNQKFIKTEQLTDLDKVIYAHQQAVSNAFTGSLSLSQHLDNLGNSWMTRYELTKERLDLDRSIQTWESALLLTEQSWYTYSIVLVNLGLGLKARYEQTDDISDLNQAIQYLEEGVQQTAYDNISFLRNLDSLGLGLKARYEKTQDLSDLDRAIQVWKDAVACSGIVLEDKSVLISHLLSGLQERYRCTRNQLDLESIAQIEQQRLLIFSPKGLADKVEGIESLEHNLANERAIAIIEALLREQPVELKIDDLNEAFFDMLSQMQQQIDPEHEDCRRLKEIEIYLQNMLLFNPPDSLKPILEKLRDTDSLKSISESIQLIEKGLKVLSQEAYFNAVFYAELQFMLGKILLYNPEGEKRLNIERAIAAFKETLGVLPGNRGGWGTTFIYLAQAYEQRIDGDPVENIEEAIEAYENASQHLSFQSNRDEWIMVKANLAEKYIARRRGSRAENANRAIALGQQLLQVLDQKADLIIWARTNSILAAAYTQNPEGNRAKNLEEAIYFSQNAVSCLSYDTEPATWLSAMLTLMETHYFQTQGNRAENLECALEIGKQILQRITQQTYPDFWARVLANLGNVYRERIRGDRAENIECAIESSEQARDFQRTNTLNWAAYTMTLASAYAMRMDGNPAENLERAIALYNQALQYFTPHAYPFEWAGIMHNLGSVYSDRIVGGRVENLERSVEYYEQALQVFTRQASPIEWFQSLNGLLSVQTSPILENRSLALGDVIETYEQILQVCTRQDFPIEWCKVMNNLANCYKHSSARGRSENIERAIQIYKEILQIRTRESSPQEWSTTLYNLALCYIERIHGNRSQNIEQVIDFCQQILQVQAQENMPIEWAGETMNLLAGAYTIRQEGDHAENIQRAKTIYHQALRIALPDTMPEECYRLARRLGDLSFSGQCWTEAADAYLMALHAKNNLYKESLIQPSRVVELSDLTTLSHNAAYALANIGRLAEAVSILEQGQARQLSEKLARHRSDLEGIRAIDANAYECYQRAANRLFHIESKERKQSNLLADDHQRISLHTLSSQMSQAHKTLQDAIAQIRSLPGYETFLNQWDFSDIAQMVQADQPIIYGLTTTAGGLALIVHQSIDALSLISDDIVIQPIWLNQATKSNLERLILTSGDPIDSVSSMSWFDAYSYRDTSHETWFATISDITSQLWQVFVEPIIQFLETLRVCKAIWIPTGLLVFLPLHAAWIEDATTATGKRYALDEIHFTYAPNTRSLNAAAAVAQRTGADSILAIDNPLQDLPNSNREVTAAIASFPQHKVLSQKEATISSVLDTLPHYTILHLSCHGTANLHEPLTSGLAMSDGLLTLRDLLNLKLVNNNEGGIRLAVLSACETGLQGIELVDEVISLPTGLLQVGVAGVVASLWSVSDLSTMMLLTRFYDFWRIEGLEIAQALRQAQQWVRDTTNGEKIAYFKDFIPEQSAAKVPASIADYLYKSLILSCPNDRDFAHPFHWAAFSYTGV